MRLLWLTVFIGLIYADQLDNAETYTERECPCDPSKLWLDIVVAIDTSIGMSSEGLTQVLANIATAFETTKFAQGEGHHSRISVITYAENATTRFGLTDIKSNDDLMDRIWDIDLEGENASNLKMALQRSQEVIKSASEPKSAGDVGTLRQLVKKVLIIYASDYRDEYEHDAQQLADQIKISGTNIIVVSFDQGGKPHQLEKLKKIATPGYCFPNTIDNLVSEIRQALCQTNCFCKKQWTQYASTVGESMVKFGECLRIAKKACIKMGYRRGHLANIFDLSKHEFVAQLFKSDYRVQPPYMYHIGLHYDQQKNAYFWEEKAGSKPIPLGDGAFKKWNKGFPVKSENIKNYGCVMAAQDSTSFKLGWQDIHCRTVPKRYICQVETCDTTNYCEN